MSSTGSVCATQAVAIRICLTGLGGSTGKTSVCVRRPSAEVCSRKKIGIVDVWLRAWLRSAALSGSRACSHETDVSVRPQRALEFVLYLIEICHELCAHVLIGPSRA
jgi:hypothetical protein